MNKILLDTLGGDFGYPEAVHGAVNSVNKFNIQITLVGPKEKLEKELKKYKYDKSLISIIDAKDEISCNDIPTMAIRQKVDSSLVVGFNEFKNDEYFAYLSAGSTGAVLTGGVLKIGRIKGINRPALCPLLPTIDNKKVMLIDCGANVDCKSINISQFALMANEYMKNVEHIDNPKIGLLNIGVEENKGNELIKESYQNLKNLPINFVGNIEAREFLSGDVDVIVSDGFSGNVLLKGTEGAVMMVLKQLKSEIKSSFSAKIGYLFMKKSFKRLKKKLDTNAYGGSIFLGLKKLLIKLHGSSTSKAYESAIEQAIKFNDNNVIQKIEQNLKLGIEDLNE